jgi:hypothetical protein
MSGAGAAVKSEGEKSPKCACVMTTEGHEVVGPGYTILPGIVGPRTVKGGEVSANGSGSKQICPGTACKVGRASGGRNLVRGSENVGSLRGGQVNDVVARMKRRPAPRWCLSSISKTQRRRLQKLHQRELAEKREEEEHDRWFHHALPMMKVKRTWWEKWLAREENGSDNDSSHSEKSDERKPTTEEHGGKVHGSETTSVEVNMVFTIPAEFWAPEENVVELALDGKPMGQMMVDGGASMNIMPLAVFKKLGHDEKDSK